MRQFPDLVRIRSFNQNLPDAFSISIGHGEKIICITQRESDDISMIYSSMALVQMAYIYCYLFRQNENTWDVNWRHILYTWTFMVIPVKDKNKYNTIYNKYLYEKSNVHAEKIQSRVDFICNCFILTPVNYIQDYI